MASVNSFEAPDYAVWGLSGNRFTMVNSSQEPQFTSSSFHSHIAGALVLIALLSALYALPWRKLCSRHHRQHFEPFNDLWGTKIILEIVLGVWAVRLYIYYFNNNIFFSGKIK